MGTGQQIHLCDRINLHIRPMISNKFKIGDAVIIAAVLLAAMLSSLVMWLPAESGKIVEAVNSDGCIGTFRLDTDGEYIIESGGYTLVLTVSDGKASVSESDCRCGICTAHAPVSRSGETIVCLPAGVSIRVIGNSEVDGEAG